MDLNEYVKSHAVRKDYIAFRRALDAGGRAREFWADLRVSKRLGRQLLGMIEEEFERSGFEDLGDYCQAVYGKWLGRVLKERQSAVDPMRRWEGTPELKAYYRYLTTFALTDNGMHPEPTVTEDGTVEVRWFSDEDDEDQPPEA